MKVLVLGNARDRLQQQKFIDNWKDEIWVCNHGFREALKLNVTLMGTVHDWCGIEALDFRALHNLNYRIVTSTRISQSTEIFKKYRGWSSGLELIHQAIIEEYDEIYLAGYCFIGQSEEDLYHPETPLYTGNFRKQWSHIQEEFPEKLKNIHFVPFD